MRYWDVGQGDVDWRDIQVIIVTLPYDSPLARQQYPKDWHWYHPLSDLMAGVYDSLGIGNATRRVRRFKKSDLPKRLRRPWDVVTSEKKVGTRKMTIDKMNRFLGIE